MNGMYCEYVMDSEGWKNCYVALQRVAEVSTFPYNAVWIKVHSEQHTLKLTLELALVLVHHLVFSYQDLGGGFQAHYTGTGHQEEHDKLLTHHTQRLVLTAGCGSLGKRFSIAIHVINSLSMHEGFE